MNGSILVVDDDESIIGMFQSMLRAEGFYVETVKTGVEALNKVRRNRFDLVLLDVMLPDIRGDEVAARIRRENNSINIVLITGYPEFQHCIDALNIGVQEILVKPIHPFEIIRVVKECMLVKA